MSLPDEMWLVASAQLAQHALLVHQNSLDFDDTDCLPEGFEDEDIDIAMHDTGITITDLLQMSTDAVTIWQFLSKARGRRGQYNQIAKCHEYFEKALSWPDKEFRHEFRLSRATFDKLVYHLEKNPIFTSKGRKPQKPIRYQLAVFLMRYGSRGSDALSVAKRMGIGLGTVWLYCRRVTRALRELGVTMISWGDEARRAETAEYIQEISGLSDCIGILDGSLIRLCDIPTEWGTLYFCRKKFPAVNVQAVVDHEKRFISYEMGWPGSMTDVTILKNSHLWKNRKQFFTGNQYILADRGYQSSPYTLRPFTEPEVEEHEGAERQRRLAFNKNLSGIRVYVEHAFGLLKGRFLSLKDFGRHNNVQDIYRVIQALMAVHNLCIDMGDHPYEFLVDGLADEVIGGPDVETSGYGGVIIDEVDENRVPAYETDDWHKLEGNRKRDRFLNDLFPVENYQ